MLSGPGFDVIIPTSNMGVGSSIRGGSYSLKNKDIGLRRRVAGDN
jgi:hypothetical protein